MHTERSRTVRAGSLIPLVLAAILVAGILGVSLMDRAVRGRSTGAWSRDHLALRLLAESAVEELCVTLQRQAATPGTALFRALRTLPASARSMPVRLDAPQLPRLTGELADQGRALGGNLRVSYDVAVRKVTHGSDPLETTGLVVVEAQVRLERARRPALSGMVRSERPFRISRVTPPRPLDGVGLLVGRTTQQDLAGCRGRMAFALARGGPHPLVELMTRKSPEAFRTVPEKTRRAILSTMAELGPAALDRRAHLVVASGAEMYRLVAAVGRVGGRLDGVVHVVSRDPVLVEFPRFKGRCLLSFAGSVQVGDIRLDDPRADSLTIVTPTRIVVTGRQIEASLIHTGASDDGLVLMQRASIRGAVVCARFPKASGLPWQELGDCRFESSPELSSGTASAASPDDTLLERHVFSLAPYPVAVQHARDRREWVEW